jgi:predicted secreted hydrolase
MAVITTASQPSDFKQDDDFPFQWWDATGKLHCEKANQHKFPRPCPLCKGFQYKNYANWQQHIADDHKYKVTTVYMDEQKKTRREFSV